MSRGFFWLGGCSGVHHEESLEYPFLSISLFIM